uniref:Uncharacterized protein n=1 Tax=Anopheles atroparvus TaxID=41427 RepID=A0AAG5DKP0_ANOAO
MLQVLEIQLGGNDYVLFVVTTDQWHNVYLAHGEKSQSSSSVTLIHTAQPVQRIKYSGTVSKARLLECNGNVYLVTIVTYSNMGKIRVYRWMQSYFSLESTKEMVSIDDVQCHCPSTLLLLVLDYAPPPERSLVHVLLLDAAERPVKVQEMFFLSSPLHSFTLEGELYLIRHVSANKSYLYQWDAEGKFVRVRKLPYQPGQITTVTHWDGTLAVAVEGTVRLFGAGKQHLLRIETPFTVRGVRQSEATTQLVPAADMGGHLVRLFGMRTDSANEVAMAAEFSCAVANGTALRIFQLTLMNLARAAEAQDHGFRTLASCLQRLKLDTNERKKWIDLLRAQLSRKNLVFDALAQSGPGRLSARVHPSAVLASVVVPHDSPSNLLPPSRTVLNGHSLLLRHFRLATDLNQVLLLNRERTEIRGNLHVAGDVRTRSSKISAVNSLADNGRLGRGKRASAAQVPHRVLKAREVISDSTLSQRFVRRSKMNVLPGNVQLGTLNAGSVRVELGHINHVTLPSRQALQDSATHGYHGHKVFRSVRSYRLNAHRFNGEPLAAQIIESGLRSTSDGITIKTDLCRSRNIQIRHTLNGFHLQRLVTAYQPIQHVKGNVRLASPVCVKNLQYLRTLNGAMRAELLDRVTNQTVAGPMFVSKGFTHSLRVQRVNGEPLVNYASTAAHQTASLLTKAPVRAEKMIILGDLIANHAEQQFAASHIGTHPSDFRQLYRGKLLLNGSLRLRAATIAAPNVTIKGRTVPSRPYQQYLLRTERQVLEKAPTAAYRTVQFQYLFANTLNGVALWQFSLIHRSWQNAMYLQDATVQGHVRPSHISKRLQSIKRSRVDLNARVQVCSVRNFVGMLRVAHLSTHFIGEAFTPDVLMRRQRSPLPSAAPKSLLSRTTLFGTTMHVRGPLQAQLFNGRSAYELAELAAPSTTRRRHFRALQVASAQAATTDILRQAAVGELPLGDFVPRFAASPTQTATGTPRFARIVAPPGAVQHIAAAHIASINLCSVDRLLQETVHKQMGSSRAIEGQKRVRGSLAVTDSLRVATVNGQEAALLEHAMTRGSLTPQSIEARWSFGAMAASYLTAKMLNRVSLSRLALRTDPELLLQSELFVERLLVSELRWPERASWNLDAYASGAPHQSTSAVALLRCYGSVYERTRDPSHVLHELLLAPSADTARVIAGLVVFDTPHVHFGNSSTPAGPAWIERIAKQCLRRPGGASTPSSVHSPPVVFEHEQILLTLDEIVVRGDLIVAEQSQLMARTIGGVNVAERLGPDTNVYRAPTPGPPRLIAGEKWFHTHGGSAHNVTLDRRNPPGFWRTLTFCAHPADSACAKAVLHFGEVPLFVEHLLTAVQLNRVPIDGFFHAFAKRRSPPLPESATLRHIQDLLGTLTVSDLQLDGPGTILHHVNSIALGELVLRSTANATHQTVASPKHFRLLRLGGPLSLQQLNGASLARLKHALLAAAEDPVALDATLFHGPVRLAGLHTRTLYHRPTTSAALTSATSVHHRQRVAQQHPLAALELRPPSYGLATVYAATVVSRQSHRRNGETATAARHVGEVVLLSGGGTVRVNCSDEQHALVIALTSARRHPTASNGTLEQRLHELPGAARCIEVTGAAALNETFVLILVRRPDDHAAYQYDVARGRILPLPLLASIGAGQTRLLQPGGAAGELMLATTTTTSSPSLRGAPSVSLERVVRIFRFDQASSSFHHFQTISSGAPVSAMDRTPDGTALLLHSAATNRRHRYVYNSVEGWTRNDVLP